MTVAQGATHEAIELLQANDVPLDITLRLNDPVTGDPVPNWASVEVQFQATWNGTVLTLRSDGVNPQITKQAQVPAGTGDTAIVVSFTRGNLAEPIAGNHTVNVIDPTVPTVSTTDSVLTYHYGAFRVKRLVPDGVLTGWVPTPSTAAGGVLSGFFPDPSFAVDMATQAELNAAIAGIGPSGVASVTPGNTTITIAGTAADPTVAVTPSTFDPAGSAGTAQAFSIQRGNHSGTQAIATVSSLQSTLAAKVAKAGDTMTGPLVVSPSSAAAVPAVLRGAADQTADLQQWQNSAGTALLGVSSAGSLTSPGDMNITPGGGLMITPPVGSATGIRGSGVISYVEGNYPTAAALRADTYSYNSPQSMGLRVRIVDTQVGDAIQVGKGVSDSIIFKVQADGSVGLREQTAPSAPAADGLLLYAEDNGAGKTRLVVKFATGAAVVIATQA